MTRVESSSGPQCPHVPLQATNPAQEGRTALSKSKKRRLKKKKKSETTSQEALETSVTTSDTAKSPSNVSEPSIKSESLVIEKTQISRGTNDKTVVLNVEPKTVQSKHHYSKDVELDLKSDSTDGLKSSIGKSKATSNLIVKQDESTSATMETSKCTRDEVMALREAKKLAKVAKKKKSGGAQAVEPKANEANSEVSLVSNDCQNSLNAVSSVTAQMKQLVVDSVDGEVVIGSHKVGVSVPVLKKAVSSDSKPISAPPSAAKPEKSREEIMAEREAKKQAKLAAKNKKKDVLPSDPAKPVEQTSTVPKSVVQSSEPPKPGVELTKSGSSQDHGIDVTQNGQIAEKSKSALKAERRAKQEAQRAAKDSTKKEAEKVKPTVKPEPITNPKDLKILTPKSTCKPNAKSTIKATNNQPKLLSHLLTDNKPLPPHIYQNVHPAIVELGSKYAARVVSGSNARCIALLQALKRVIVDFVTPREKEFSRAMESRLNDSMAYLNASRQSSVSMTNALKHVKSHLTQLTAEKTTEDDARKKLCEVIDTFIKDEIDVAGQAISIAVAEKISAGDTIAIYGCSSLLLRILVESHNECKDFEVVVVDGGPLYEGREMCRRLVEENIKCTYVLLPAFSYIVGQTTKVLLGAHALLANGCVMSRSGTAAIAMLAKSHNVPVIVCCETYKFCERVQADAFVHNELVPQDKSSSPPSISLMYDLTPPTLVDAVATELAILPCTSVPVILRVKPSDISSYYY